VFLGTVGGPFYLGTFGLGSPSTDLPAALFTAFGLGLGFQSYFRREEMLWQYGCTLIILAALIKLSQILALAPMSLLWLLSAKRQIPWRVIGATTLIVALWCWRSLEISGCVVFPVKATCVMGIVAPEEAEYLANEVKGWARHPGAEYMKYVSGWAWVETWLKDNAPLTREICVIFFMALLGVMFGAGRAKNAMIFIALLSTWVAWFYVAPDPRFGWGFFLGMAEFSFWSIARAEFRGFNFVYVNRGALVILVVGLISKVQMDKLRKADEWLIIPQADYREIRRNNFSVPVKLAVESDQCWNLAVPCTPYDKMLKNLMVERFGNRLMFSRHE
jgi:hypothetical protein